MSSIKKIATILVFLAAVIVVPAQQAPSRKRTYDIQHYVLRSEFDRVNKVYFGDASVTVKPLAGGFTTLELDAAGLTYKSVTLEESGAQLKYSQRGDKLSIALDRQYAPEDKIKVRIKYSAKPKKGIYFVDEYKDGGTLINPAQVWTQGEPEEAHHWFPSYDFPDDKATSEQILKVSAGETAIANGELLSVKENGDGTRTFHYKMDKPHPVYLISFVVGNYVKVSDDYKGIPLGYYVYPGKESIVEKAYSKTKDMMRIFEELTGIPYPYNKYDQTIVARFTFGGMENITATTMADSEIFFSQYDFGKENVVDLVSHELAHSWFGNLVTCKNWSELWLNEGFATFMEAAFREKLNGRADYMRKVREDAARYIASDSTAQNRHALFNKLARPDDSIFDTTTYQKGGAIVHTLREEVGDQAFWKAVNIYLERHKFGNVESVDLKKVMEEVTGRDLKWFFDQWVFMGGYPNLVVKQQYSPSRKTLRLTVSQTQRADQVTPGVFTLPLDIQVETAKGPENSTIKLEKRVQTFDLKVSERPRKILIDKDLKIPVKVVKIQPPSKWAGK